MYQSFSGNLNEWLFFIKIYKRKQESKWKENTLSTRKKRKNDNGQERKRPRKHERKHALDQESKIQEKMIY